MLKAGPACGSGSKFSCPATEKGQTCCGADTPCGKQAE
jgi:hypothetical protein